ncbi:hypothetical protein E2562_018829 [Oryza meyeriana var. granulata]|uniref:Uncharacterized protein n=1 Tax=Oryza meyeriana var. granulata TaxID=110450 RepID=A0A6G1F9P6_9ORYZ|nr:hypothetical protein E2562_018829 [Oryza meyeriana var. granulata]
MPASVSDVDDDADNSGSGVSPMSPLESVFVWTGSVPTHSCVCAEPGEADDTAPEEDNVLDAVPDRSQD